MKYKSFYIKNYKGIKQLTLDLDKDPSMKILTLVGLNESGKTTILEAIAALNSDENPAEIHKLIPKSRKFSFSDTIEIHATLNFDEIDQKFLTTYMVSQGYKSIDPLKDFKKKVIYKFKNSEYIESESGKKYEFYLMAKKGKEQYSKSFNSKSPEYINLQEFICKELLPPIIYYPNFLFNFPNRIYLEHSITEDKEQVTYRAVISDIMDTFNEGLTIEDHIINRLRNLTEGNEESLDSTIDRMSIQITKVVFSAWGQLFDSSGKEIRLKPGIDLSNNLAYLEVKLKEGSELFQISERSLGFKWFFTFLLFTEFRKNRSKENGEILFLLDEPASNLHSTAQKNLLTTFEKLVSNCKMIYTTHSHHLINPKWLSGAFIVRNKAIDYENEFNSIVEKTDVEATIYRQFVVKHPTQFTYFQPILDSLEYSPSLIEEVPFIILTEGKNDYYTFRYLNEIILNNYSEFKFYPGNGADRNYQIIATYLAWNRDFLILLDGDGPGESAKKRYIKEFGPIIQEKIITLKDINPEFTFPLESIFAPIDQINVIKYYSGSATSFDKSKFNTAIQLLFINCELFSLDNETILNFKQVFDFINAKKTVST
jgi:predicted ATPase